MFISCGMFGFIRATCSDHRPRTDRGSVFILAVTSLQCPLHQFSLIPSSSCSRVILRVQAVQASIMRTSRSPHRRRYRGRPTDTSHTPDHGPEGHQSSTYDNANVSYRERHDDPQGTAYASMYDVVSYTLMYDNDPYTSMYDNEPNTSTSNQPTRDQGTSNSSRALSPGQYACPNTHGAYNNEGQGVDEYYGPQAQTDRFHDSNWHQSNTMQGGNCSAENNEIGGTTGGTELSSGPPAQADRPPAPAPRTQSGEGFRRLLFSADNKVKRFIQHLTE